MEWWKILVLVIGGTWAAGSFCFMLAYVIMWESHDEYCPAHPSHIHQHAGVNWFGAMLLYIIYLICCFPVAVIRFIVWLCRTGVGEK